MAWRHILLLRRRRLLFVPIVVAAVAAVQQIWRDARLSTLAPVTHRVFARRRKQVSNERFAP